MRIPDRQLDTLRALVPEGCSMVITRTRRGFDIWLENEWVLTGVPEVVEVFVRGFAAGWQLSGDKP